MKRTFNKLSALALSLVMLLGICVTAYAHDVVDMERLCSITITTRKGDTPVSGGTLTIYRVGEVVENDGNASFLPAGDFAICGESFDVLDASGDIAARLKAFADQNAVTGLATKQVGADGTVVFDSLPVGLYLVVQHQAAPGYAALEPFLVSLPYLDGGKYVYELSANPKTNLEQQPEPTEPPSETPTDPSLPQTGQLHWPVPVLALSGMVMFAAGWMLFMRKEKQDEA